MAGDKKMDVPDMKEISIVTEKATSDHTLNPLTDDLIGNFNLTVEGLNVQDDIILNSFNLTDVNGTDDHLPQVFNDTLLVSSQTERDSFLIDTAMQIFYDYFYRGPHPYRHESDKLMNRFGNALNIRGSIDFPYGFVNHVI